MRSQHDRSAQQTLELGRRLSADRHLQAEIDKGIASLAAGLPSPVGLRLARVLVAVLEPSWSEHVGFQDVVLFPIIAKATDTPSEVRNLLEGLGREHDEIGARHVEVTAILNTFIAGRHKSTELTAPLAQTFSLRRRHHDAEAALEDAIPAALDADDSAAFKRWTASRADSPFPMNLILDIWD
ncbi:hypothetical protein [Hyphomicrobium sp.]|uniref:hypothetical protein n=1 Tax=Hyphomicrobium sp. TaxID=82 RepID=UPI0025C5B4D9|nr:hypothetical protein [Hyphomicrobium sp.]MCC7254210.1 hypothetical protein [Hyphomicrobium sp.]